LKVVRFHQILEGKLDGLIDKEDGASYWTIEYFKYKRCVKIALKKSDPHTWDFCFKKYPEYVNGTNRNCEHQAGLFKEMPVGTYDEVVSQSRELLMGPKK